MVLQNGFANLLTWKLQHLFVFHYSSNFVELFHSTLSNCFFFFFTKTLPFISVPLSFSDLSFLLLFCFIFQPMFYPRPFNFPFVALTFTAHSLSVGETVNEQRWLDKEAAGNKECGEQADRKRDIKGRFVYGTAQRDCNSVF